jgi:hypothetical protein
MYIPSIYVLERYGLEAAGAFAIVTFPLGEIVEV